MLVIYFLFSLVGSFAFLHRRQYSNVKSTKIINIPVRFEDDSESISMQLVIEKMVFSMNLRRYTSWYHFIIAFLEKFPATVGDYSYDVVISLNLKRTRSQKVPWAVA